MERVLSEEQCANLITQAERQEWERVDRYGVYNQTFISDTDIFKTIQDYFGREFAEEPIFKVIKFNVGDYIPLFSADYSNKKDQYYSRYINTNFIIQTYLNSNFDGGVLSVGESKVEPKVGYGVIQNKTQKCSFSKVEKGIAYLLFVFIFKIKTTSLL
jgi:hypothetical protein